MLERFLERISLSDYRDNFILKGGMLIASIVGIDARATMDMDTTVKGFDLEEKNLEEVINEILSVNINDEVCLTINNLKRIRDFSKYPGIRVSIDALLGKTKQTMKIDITTGDVITPKATEKLFKLMLEDRYISILAYNIETILAEKLETIISRGLTSTRMRDYYDIYILMKLQGDNLNASIFRRGFKNTSAQRNTYEQIKLNGFEYLRKIESSEVMIKRWRQYCSKNKYASNIMWSDILKSINKTFIKTL